MATSKSIHNDALFLKRLADEWNEILAGCVFLRSASISASEIYLLFSSACWKCQLFQGSLLIQDVPRENFPRRKTIQQFKLLQEKSVRDVRWTPFDRQISIRLDDVNALTFQFFGRRANICHVRDGLVESVFGYPVTDVQTEDKKIDFTCASQTDFLHLHRFVTPEFNDTLEDNGFYTSDNKAETWKQSLESFWSRDFCLKRLPKPVLLWAHDCDQYNRDMTFSSPVRAFSAFSKQFISFESKRLLRQAALVEVEKQHRKTSKSLKRAKSALKKLQSETSPKEKADVLMANLHVVQKGQESAELFNFYTQEPLILKLDPLLNAQENAEKLYRKAKRRHIQIAKAEETVRHYEDNLLILEKKRKEVESDSWEAPKLNKQKKTEKITDKPWKEDVFEGITIRIGKNAVSNDALLKASKKHWVWMHARETSGSHVVLETDNPSNKLLEYAASLAAFNSKAKASGLVPVIYTPLKYVRKFKNAAPGQVRVEKEKVILIEPELWKERTTNKS
jgi:hypothetical protein